MFDFPSRNKVSRNKVSMALVNAVGAYFNEHELKTIDRLGTAVELTDGTTLTQQGRPGRETMLILSGSAEVQRDGTTVASVAAGDIIGERAVLTGEPRNATLVATSDVGIVVFNPREFKQLLAECPRLNASVDALQDERVATA